MCTSTEGGGCKSKGWIALNLVDLCVSSPTRQHFFYSPSDSIRVWFNSPCKISALLWMWSSYCILGNRCPMKPLSTTRGDKFVFKKLCLTEASVMLNTPPTWQPCIIAHQSCIQPDNIASNLTTLLSDYKLSLIDNLAFPLGTSLPDLLDRIAAPYSTF